MAVVGVPQFFLIPPVVLFTEGHGIGVGVICILIHETQTLPATPALFSATEVFIRFLK